MTTGKRTAALVVNGVATVGLAVATALTWSDSGGNPHVGAALGDGRALFAAKGCIGCHIGPDGEGQGISLVGVPSRDPDLDRAAYIRQSIRRPGAVISPGGATSPVPMPTLAVSARRSRGPGQLSRDGRTRLVSPASPGSAAGLDQPDARRRLARSLSKCPSPNR